KKHKDTAPTRKNCWEIDPDLYLALWHVVKPGILQTPETAQEQLNVMRNIYESRIESCNQLMNDAPLFSHATRAELEKLPLPTLGMATETIRSSHSGNRAKEFERKLDNYGRANKQASACMSDADIESVKSGDKKEWNRVNN